MATPKKKAPKKKARKKAKKKITKRVDKYGLSAKHRKFADLYHGGPDAVIGNAKRCYM